MKLMYFTGRKYSVNMLCVMKSYFQMKEEKKSSRTMTSWRKHVCGAVACINTENPKRKQLQMKYSNDGKQWSLGYYCSIVQQSPACMLLPNKIISLKFRPKQIISDDEGNFQEHCSSSTEASRDDRRRRSPHLAIDQPFDHSFPPPSSRAFIALQFLASA